MESLDTTILNTAVPAIAQALKVPPLSMKAVLASYTLSLAVFIPISGWMANRFGTRRVFASAIGIFTFGSFLCGISNNIHLLVACRVLQGCGGAMMLPVGRLTMVRAFAKSELIDGHELRRHSGTDRSHARASARRLDHRIFSLERDFLRQHPDRPVRPVHGLSASAQLPRAAQHPLDIVGLVLFGSGVSLLSYVLEVFGETTLSGREILGLLAMSAALLGAYGLHSVRTAHPLLRLGLVRMRSFRVAVTGNLFTRLGIGGIPFLLPLLYQVGLGFTPIQSGLLIMPQALAAMSLKLTMPLILKRFGYRTGADRQHHRPGPDDFPVLDHRCRHAGVGDRADGLHLWVPHLAAVHQHEHPGLCRRERARSQRRQHHRQHRAANGGELRRRRRLARRRAVHPR